MPSKAVTHMVKSKAKASAMAMEVCTSSNTSSLSLSGSASLGPPGSKTTGFTSGVSSLESTSGLQWKVRGFGKLDQGNGVGLCSPVFSTAGIMDSVEWCMCLYPRGRSQQDSSHVSIYLKLTRSPLPRIDAHFVILLVDSTGRELWSPGPLQHVFIRKDEMCGYDRYAARRQLIKPNSKLRDSKDTLIFKCRLTTKMSTEGGGSGEAGMIVEGPMSLPPSTTSSSTSTTTSSIKQKKGGIGEVTSLMKKMDLMAAGIGGKENGVSGKEGSEGPSKGKSGKEIGEVTDSEGKDKGKSAADKGKGSSDDKSKSNSDDKGKSNSDDKGKGSSDDKGKGSSDDKGKGTDDKSKGTDDKSKGNDGKGKPTEDKGKTKGNENKEKGKEVSGGGGSTPIPPTPSSPDPPTHTVPCVFGFQWNIHRFSQVAHKVGDLLRSPMFTTPTTPLTAVTSSSSTAAGGGDEAGMVMTDPASTVWQLLLYPGGYDETSDVSAFLRLVQCSESGGQVQAAFTLYVLDASGQSVASHTGKSMFKPGGTGFGSKKLVTRQILLNPKLEVLVDDNLILRCRIGPPQ